MPRAPQIEQRVESAPLPGVRLSGAPSAQSYGAGVGELGARVGLALYEQEAITADRTAVFEADREAADLQTQLEGKLRQTKGKNVLGIDEVIKKKWDEGIAQIEGGLTGARQRMAFAGRKAARGDQLNRVTQGHISSEYERFQDEETDAGLKSAIDRIRNNPDVPEIIGGEMNRMKSLVGAAAVRKGWMGTVTKEQLATPQFHEPYTRTGQATPAEGEPYFTEKYHETLQAALSKGHREVITGLNLKGRDLDAAAYFKANKGELVAGDRDAVEQGLDEGSTRGEAQRLVRGLIRDGKTEGEILNHIDTTVDNPKIVDLAHQLTARHFREQAAITKQQSDDIYLDAANTIEKNPGANPRLLVDPDKWAMLSLNERHSLEERAKALVKYEKPDRPNDDRLWLDFLDLKPEQVAGLSRREFDDKYWSKFDNHTRQRAETQWNTYKDALAKGKGAELKITPTLTFKDQVQNAWSLSGLIDPSKEKSKWSTDEMKQFVRFENEAAAAVQAYEMTKLEGKRHATPDEVRAIVDEVKKKAVQTVFTKGWFGNTQRAVVSLEEDEKKQVFVPLDKIPKDSLDDLRRYIESLGKTATADKLRRAYGQRLLNNRQAFDAIVNE